MGRRTKGCPRDRSEQQQNAAAVGPLDAGVGSGARSPRELWRPGRARTSAPAAAGARAGCALGKVSRPRARWAPGLREGRAPACLATCPAPARGDTEPVLLRSRADVSGRGRGCRGALPPRSCEGALRGVPPPRGWVWARGEAARTQGRGPCTATHVGGDRSIEEPGDPQ